MLKHHRFANIQTLAFRHPLVGAPRVGFHGGPVIQDPEWQDLRHTRYHRPVDWFDGAEGSSDSLAGDYVYVGPVYDHFGHVMSEMIHRLLPATAAFPGRDLLIVSTVNDPRHTSFDTFASFYRDVLTFFAVDPARIVVLNQDRIVERLEIFEQGSDFGGGPKPDYLDGLQGFSDRLMGHLPAGPPKVYVSRSALPGGGGFLGERYLEQCLEEQGFVIARPETLPLIEQMRLYRHARLVVFPEGSACHGVELLGPEAIDTVIFIARRRDHMDIFKRVLAPRSKRYIAIDPPSDTGSVLNREKHNTIGLIDFVALFNHLKACGVTPAGFKVDRYAEAAEADFGRYVEYLAATRADAIDGALLLEKSRSFAAMFKRLREMAAAT